MNWNMIRTSFCTFYVGLQRQNLLRTQSVCVAGANIATSLFVVVLFGILPTARYANAQIDTTFTEPAVSSELAFAESGIVQKVHVKPGDYISKGSIVAELRSGVLQRALASAKAKADSTARINAAKAKLRLTAQKNESLKKLDRNGFANRQEVLRATTEFEQAKAELQLAMDENEIAGLEFKQIEAQLERRVIRSPFDGHIIEVHKEVGEYVSGSEPQFATLVVLEDLRARFYLIDRQAAHLAAGDTVGINIDKTPTTARVVFVSPIIDPDSRTVRVEVEIHNADGNYISGEPCRWTEKERSKSTKTVPASVGR